MNKTKISLLLIFNLLIICLNPNDIYGSDSLLIDPYDISLYKRSVNFSGHTFKVKDSSLSTTGRLGPNQNIFNDSETNVLIDSQGRLILNLTPSNLSWHAAEIISTEEFGYGTYTFKLASRIDQLDPNVTFSIFLYKDDANEIDIEFSNFGHYNSQFIVQPYEVPGHMQTYTSSLNGAYTSYVIHYQPNSITFKAYHGHNTNNKSNLIHEWTYTGKGIPSAEGMKLRFNLYLRHTDRPENNKLQQIIIKDFNYVQA